MKLEKLLSALQATVYFPEILKVKESFEAGKIDFLFLKGLPLYLYFEKSPPRRILADCDVLIDKNAEEKVKKIFDRLGYQLAETAYSKFHQRLKDKLTEATYFKLINNCLVAFDVHFEVVFLMNQLGRMDALYPQSLVDEMTRKFLKQKQKVKIKGREFPILSPSNLIIYLSLHFFHHNFRGWHRLKFLNKIVRYYGKDMINELGREIIDKIKYYRLRNFVYPGFIMLNARFGRVFPQRIIDSIKPDRPALKYIDKLIRSQNITGREDHLAAGINRFKNIFYLSPYPWPRKILIFLNKAVIYSIIWSMVNKIGSILMKINKSHFVIYKLLWVLWLLLWVIIPFRLIRPLFFDKFIYLKDPEYGYVRKADGGKSCTADLNSNGFRDEEFYSKKEGEFLILIVGDSLVYGQGLKVEDRYTNVLEKELKQIRNTQIFNLGKCSSNLLENYIRAEKFRRKLNPDLVIFTFYENDLLISKDLSDAPDNIIQKDDNRIVFDPSSPEESPEYDERVLGTYDEDTLNYKLLNMIPLFPRSKTLYFFVSENPSKTVISHIKKVRDMFSMSGLMVIDNFDIYRDKYEALFAKRKYGPYISLREGHPNALANQMFAERLYREITGNQELGFIKKYSGPKL